MLSRRLSTLGHTHVPAAVLAIFSTEPPRCMGTLSLAPLGRAPPAGPRVSPLGYPRRPFSSLGRGLPPDCITSPLRSTCRVGVSLCPLCHSSMNHCNPASTLSYHQHSSALLVFASHPFLKVAMPNAVKSSCCRFSESTSCLFPRVSYEYLAPPQ